MARIRAQEEWTVWVLDAGCTPLVQATVLSCYRIIVLGAFEHKIPPHSHRLGI